MLRHLHFTLDLAPTFSCRPGCALSESASLTFLQVSGYGGVLGEWGWSLTSKGDSRADQPRMACPGGGGSMGKDSLYFCP